MEADLDRPRAQRKRAKRERQHLSRAARAPAAAIDARAQTLSCARTLHGFLANARRALDQEIGGYPRPIPRCDAQFNHLYQQRALIADLLLAIDAALELPSAAGAGAPLTAVFAAFLAIPAFGVSTLELNLRRRVAELTALT